RSLHSFPTRRSSDLERLNGIIKNNYLYPYGPTNQCSLKRLLDKAVLMYNTEKPHKALGKLTPIEFKKTVDNEDNSLGYLPLSTRSEEHTSELQSREN